MLDSTNPTEMRRRVECVRTCYPLRVFKWMKDRGRSFFDAGDENIKGAGIQSHIFYWSRSIELRLKQQNGFLRSDPCSGQCHWLGRLKVVLPGISLSLIDRSLLVMRSPRVGEDNSTVPQTEGQSKPKFSDVPPKKEENEPGCNKCDWDLPLKFDGPAPVINVKELGAQLQKVALEIPVFVGEYKRSTDMKGRKTGINQMRMYLTASVKYLEAVGISGVPVYGVLMEGPIAAIHAAVMKGEVCISIVLADVIQMHTTYQICPTECLCLRAADNRGEHIRANGCLALSDHILPAGRQTL